MVLFQLAVGVMTALLLWGYIKPTFRTVLWIVIVAVAFSTIIPGAFMFVSGIFLVLIGMLATLGVLFIFGTFRN